MKRRAMKGIGTISCMAFLLAGLTGWAGSAYGDDIEVRLPSNLSSDAFQVKNLFGSTRFHVQANGRVGIGTTSPGAKLEINYNSSTSTPQLLLYENDNGYARLSFENNTTTKYFTIAGNPQPTDSSSVLNFYYNNYGNIMTLTGDGNVGIGYDTPTRRLHVKDSSRYLSIINFENTYDGQYADLLNLKINKNDPGVGNEFIAFYDKYGRIGRIVGNGSGGVEYHTTGSDLSEYLPRLRADEVIDPGDIVGISAGKITKITESADYIRVVSTAPGWVGNCPGEEKEHLYEQVAFVGQVPIRVRGTVQAGDFIVPSGLNDGVGVAVSPEKLTPAQAVQVVGRAWEESSEKEVRKINSAVGLHTAAQPLHALNIKMEREIRQLIRENRALEARLASLERRVGSMQ